LGVLRSQEDGWTKEMARFEQRDVVVGGTLVMAIPFADGGRKDAPFAAYPKMLYRAEADFGGPRVSGTKIVRSEDEEAIACGQGWCVRQEDALADVGRRQQELAALAANRAHTEKWMSEAAKAEARAADEATMEHLPSIPETPIVHRQPKGGR
jgi:hypothetical protein